MIYSDDINEVDYYMKRVIKMNNDTYKDYKGKLSTMPGCQKIASKTLLSKLLQNTKYSNIMPKQFVLPQELSKFNEWAQNQNSKFIVKPSQGSYGIGIMLYNTVEEVNQYMEELLNKSKSKKNLAVVQEYIESDLINNKKYDLRIYVLQTNIDPLQLYLYKNGIVRISSVEYDENLLNNNTNSKEMKKMFLTNTYQNSKKDVKKDDIIWNIEQYFQYKKQNDQNFDQQKFWSQIEDITRQIFNKRVIQKQYSQLNNITKEKLYQFPQQYMRLFGLDILVQKDGTMKLLEINFNPSTEISSKNEKQVKKELFTDIYNIANIRDRKSNPICKKEKCKQKFLKQVFDDQLTEDQKLSLLQIVEERQYLGNFVSVKPDQSVYKVGKYNHLLKAYYDKLDNVKDQLIKIKDRKQISKWFS